MDSTSSAPHRLAYRPDVDGLRAVAVAAVVLCHAGLGLPGGYVGVDVFFVISGYLITGLILKELAAGTFSLAEFWTRRVRRIVPALLVVIVATLATGWFFLMPDAYASLGQSAAALCLLSSNVYFWQNTGYFAPAAEEKPLLHTWSLAVEEQFYLFVPLVVLVMRNARNLHRRRLAILLGLIGAASLAFSAYGASHHSVATFYLLPTRAWELLAGALLACRPARERDRPTPIGEGAAGAGLVLILLPCMVYDSHTPFPGLAALPPVLGSALLIRAGSGPVRRPAVNRLLAWHPIVFVGLISYSLYLWHWPLLAFACELTAEPLPLTGRLGLVVMSVFVAVLSWRYVELPFRHRRVLAARSRLVPAVAFASGAVFATGLFVYLSGGYEPRLPAEALTFALTGQKDWSGYAHDVRDVPDGLARLGRGESPPELLVWGDSHAMAILPGVDAVCRDVGVTAIAATHSETAPVLNYYETFKYGLNERAIPFNDAVLSYVRAAKIRKVVLVASWRRYAERDEFRAALLRTIDALNGLDVKTYFLLPVPRYQYNVPKVLYTYSVLHRDRSSLAVTLHEHRATEHLVAGLVPELLRRRVRILDPVPVFLARTGTSNLVPFDEGGTFYCDNHHLSTYGALALTPLFASIVREPADPAPPPGGHQNGHTPRNGTPE